MNTQSSDILPICLLKGVNPEEVAKKYLEGYYSNISIPRDKVTLSSDVVKLGMDVGSNSTSEIYDMKSSSFKIRFITTNHKNYEDFLNNLNGSNMKINNESKPNICMWCRRNFDNDSCGIPLKLFYDTEQKINIYYVYGNFCTFNCAYSYLKLKTNCTYTIRDHRYTDSETLLRTMFKDFYPDSKLTDFDDWELYEWNGGPISLDDFLKSKYKFKKTPNIISIPLKAEYELIKNISNNSKK